jgi:hypothetical protein
VGDPESLHCQGMASSLRDGLVVHGQVRFVQGARVVIAREANCARENHWIQAPPGSRSRVALDHCHGARVRITWRRGRHGPLRRGLPLERGRRSLASRISGDHRVPPTGVGAGTAIAGLDESSPFACANASQQASDAASTEPCGTPRGRRSSSAANCPPSVRVLSVRAVVTWVMRYTNRLG